MDKFYSVTELAKELGVTPRALRFYEDKGLILPRRAGKARVYTRRERGRMTLILRGKRLGFSLREIGDWLDLYDADPRQSAQRARLRDRIDDRIAALEHQRLDLDATLDELRAILDQVDGHPAGTGTAATRRAPAGT